MSSWTISERVPGSDTQCPEYMIDILWFIITK